MLQQPLQAIRRLLSWVLLGWRCSSGAAGVPRGVSPELQERYKPGSAFACSSGEQVPSAAVNDDFCDCADGSDEPGTGACAGLQSTLFHCENKGSTPQLVYSSRVDDGVCDCCDGSDEAGLALRRPGAVSCINRCEEEGERDRRLRAERMEMLKVGLKRKAEIEAQAKSDKEKWSAELNRLNAELPALEASVKEAKTAAASEKARSPAGGGDTAKCRKELADLKTVVRSQQEKIKSLEQELGALKSGGRQEAASDPAPGANAEGKPVVSEYAKWMDGAAETPGAIQKSVPPEEPDEAEDVKEEEQPPADELDGAAQQDEDIEEAQSASAWLKGLKGMLNSVFSRFRSQSAGSAVEAAQNKVDSHKAAVKELQLKLRQLDLEHLGFHSLAGTCLEKKDPQYTYSFCFFVNSLAKQDSVDLGRWNSWKGPKEALFDNGDTCWGGPARSLRVIFRCGSKEEVHEISEPSRCVYEVHISHPGACDSKDEAALIAPPVRHPQDEL